LLAGFTLVKVDARRDAVVAHAGHVSSLPATIDTIWTKWAWSAACVLRAGCRALSVTRTSSTRARAWAPWKCGSLWGPRPGRCALRCYDTDACSGLAAAPLAAGSALMLPHVVRR
jgi:hypothetical protein